MKLTRGRVPSPALVVSVVALVLASAGMTYAIALPKHSVGTTQLKRKSVTAKKLGPGAVRSAKFGPTIRRSVDIRIPDGPPPPIATGEATATARCLQG